nr:hypothetical protein [Sedimentibacter sp.]
MKDIIKPYRAENLLFRKSRISCKKECTSKENSDNIPGFIDVTVFDNISHKPISNAEVNIIEVAIEGIYNEKGKGTLIYNYTTDENGKVPIITLPLNKELGQYHVNYNNNGMHYHMAVLAPEYNNAYAVNLQWQVYPDITTIFKIYLSRTNEDDDPHFDFIMAPPTRKIHEM